MEQDSLEYRLSRVDDEREMQAVFAIRIAVFCREQGIPEELEIDEKDRRAIHLLARIGGKPVATGRITLDGNHGELARIAVLSDYRRNGLGAAIVRRLEAEGRDRGVRHFELTPHRHLHAFYLRLGYQGHENAGEIAGHPLIRMHKSG